MKRTVLFAQNARFILLSLSKLIIDKLGQQINTEQKRLVVPGSWEGCLNQYTLMNFECKRLSWEREHRFRPPWIFETLCTGEACYSPNVNWRGFRELASKQIWSRGIFCSEDFVRKISHLCCLWCQKSSIKNLIRVFSNQLNIPTQHLSDSIFTDARKSKHIVLCDQLRYGKIFQPHLHALSSPCRIWP